MANNNLLITVDREPALLRHLLRHNLPFGFDKIFISIYRGPETTQGFINDIRLIATEFGAFMVAMQGYQAMHSIELQQHIISKFCTKGDWLFMANVDEFHQYTNGLQALLRECSENGNDHITGHLLDRLGLQGDFPEINDKSIWDNFPVAARLTKNILNGSSTRIVAIKTGIYDPANNSTGGINIFVHLFKWDSTIFERSRYEVWKNSVEENPAFIIPLRFLRYSKNNCPLNLSDERLEVLLPSYSRNSSVGTKVDIVNIEEDIYSYELPDLAFLRPERHPEITLNFEHDINYLFDPQRNWATRISERGVKAWNLCDGSMSVAEIINEIAPSFDSGLKVEKGLHIFIIELMKTGAIYCR